MLFVQFFPPRADFFFDGLIHDAPAVMDAKLKRALLVGDRVILFAGKLEDVRKPIRKARALLEVQLDDVAVFFVVDLVIDFVLDMEKLLHLVARIPDRDVFDVVGRPARVVKIVAGVDKILFKRQMRIRHISGFLPQIIDISSPNKLLYYIRISF